MAESVTSKNLSGDHEEIENAKQRAKELAAQLAVVQQQLMDAQRVEFEKNARKIFAAIASLFDTHVRDIGVCNRDTLVYNATSPLDFGRGPHACEIARAELANRCVVALDSGVCTYTPYFKIWHDVQNYRDRKRADISFCTEDPKVAFERWTAVEALVKDKTVTEVDKIFRGVAEKLLADAYIRQSYQGLTSTIAKPRVKTVTKYTF